MASRTFQSLADNGINVDMISTSEVRDERRRRRPADVLAGEAMGFGDPGRSGRELYARYRSGCRHWIFADFGDVLVHAGAFSDKHPDVLPLSQRFNTFSSTSIRTQTLPSIAG